MQININKILPTILGFYVMCVLVLDDLPVLYMFSNVVFVFLVILTLMQRNFMVHRSAFMFSIVALMVWTGMSLFWCYDSDAVIGDIKKQILFLILVFVLTHLIHKKSDFQVIFKWFIIAGIVYFVWLMFTYGFQYFISQILAGNRIGDEFLQLNKLAMNCAIIFIIALNLLLYKKKKGYIIPMVMMLFLMLGAESRRAFLVLIICSVFSYLLYIKEEKRSRKKIIKIFIGIIIIVAAVYLFNNSSLFTSINSRFDELQNIESQDTLREKYLQYGFQSFLEHPILGLGSGNSHIITLAAAGKKTYLHNNYIEMLVNLGIVGFVIYYFIYAYLIKCLISTGVDDIETKIMLIILVGQLISDFGVTSYSYKFTYLIFGLTYALIITKKGSKMEHKCVY